MAPTIAGTIWAIRITVTLTEEEESQMTFGGLPVVCVYHSGGSRKGTYQHKPHYHIYYNAGVDVKQEKVKQALKSCPVIAKYYQPQNSFWSVTTDTRYDLDTYWKYVWDQYPSKKQRLIKWGLDIPQYEIPDLIVPADTVGNIISVGPLEAARKPKKIITSLEKQQRFYEYCKDHYDETSEEITHQTICRLLVEYCAKFGFTPESSLSCWARYAYFHLLEGKSRSDAADILATRLAGKFF